MVASIAASLEAAASRVAAVAPFVSQQYGPAQYGFKTSGGRQLPQQTRVGKRVEGETERDAAARIRRHQAYALAKVFKEVRSNFWQALPTASRPTSPPSYRAWQMLLTTSSAHLLNPRFLVEMA